MKRGVAGRIFGLCFVCLFAGASSACAMGSGKAVPSEEYVKTKIITLSHEGKGAESGTAYVYSDRFPATDIYVDGSANIYVEFSWQCAIRQYNASGNYVRTLTWNHPACSERNGWFVKISDEDDFILVSMHPNYGAEAILIHPDGEQEDIKASSELGYIYDWYFKDGCLVETKEGKGVVGRSRKGKESNAKPGMPREKMYKLDKSELVNKGEVKVRGPKESVVVKAMDVSPHKIVGIPWQKYDKAGNIYLTYMAKLEGQPHGLNGKYWLGKYGPNGKLKAWIEFERDYGSLNWGVGGNGEVFQMWLEDPEKDYPTEGSRVFVTKWEIRK